MSEKIRIGIIGCGGIAKSHVDAYTRQGIKITSVCDVNKTAACEFADKAENAEVYTDYKELIDSKDVDAVSICTPPHVHEEPAVYALEHGVHVLLEKPQASTLEAASAITEATAKSDALLMMAFRHRYLPAVQKIQSMINDGAIGKPVFFQNIFCAPAFNMKNRWFTKKSIAGGGCILDTSSHSVDLFRYLIGEVIEQKAVMHRHFEGTDVEDAGIITVKAENGAIGSMTSSFVAGDGIAFIDITGQDGRLFYDYLTPSELRFKARGKDWEIFKVEPSNGFAEETALFIDAIRNTTQSPSPALEGLRNLEVIQSIYKKGC
jgi:predicted dehydrogenase